MEYVNELISLFPTEQVTTNPNILAHHGKDESYHGFSPPDVVVFPKNAIEVSKIIEIAGKHSVPITPFGLGTSLEGHAIPYSGGISLDFSLMNRIIEILPNDFLVKVQPGVTRTQLNEALKNYGLFFSVDPGADATLGGMAATNASGTTSVRYGIMRDQVRDLEVVLADGTIINTGNLAAKSSSGYDLNGLFVGSEGTLGCFTELTLNVHGIPESIVAARASYPSISQAVQGVHEVISAGIQIARIELVDGRSIKLVNETNETNYEETPTLFMEFHGNQAGLEQDIYFTKEILKQSGCHVFKFEKDNKTRNQLWETRHNLAYSYIHSSPGKKMMVTDVCVPISKLSHGIEFAIQKLANYDLYGGILGHVGDGNYHVLLMIDPDNDQELKLANSFNEDIVKNALKLGGTCTGEHGVGVGKMKYQEQQHGESIKVMRLIKKALDPNNLMNPGKLIAKLD